MVGGYLDDRFPYGASIDLHLQVPKGGKAPYESAIVHETCEWLGTGRRCYCDGSGLCAEEAYKKYGIQSDAEGIDLLVQPDALYEEMARFLRIWTEGK
jgi:hypothetical protein